MNYYYSFSKKFLRNFHSNLNQDQAYKILNFLSENLFTKQKLFSLKMDRKLLVTKFGDSKVSTIFNHLKKKISTNIMDVYKNKNVPLDIFFKGDDEEINKLNKNVIFVTCKQILKNPDNLIKLFNQNFKDFWIGSYEQKDKRKLMDHLKRIFISCNKVYIIDRYVPAVAIDQKKHQINAYKNTFLFYSELLKKCKIEYLHISNLSEKQLDDIMKYNQKKFENNFVDLVNNLLSENEKFLIKERSHEALHERYLISLIGEDVTAMYLLNQGDLIRDKFTTVNRKIKKMDPFDTLEIWQSLSKIVENTDKNYAYVSKSGFRYK